MPLDIAPTAAVSDSTWPHVLADFISTGLDEDTVRVVDGRRDDWMDVMQSSSDHVLLVEPTFTGWALESTIAETTEVKYTVDAPFFDRLAISRVRRLVNEHRNQVVDFVGRLEYAVGQRSLLDWLVDSVRVVRAVVGGGITVRPLIHRSAGAVIEIRQSRSNLSGTLIAVPVADRAVLDLTFGLGDERMAVTLPEFSGEARPARIELMHAAGLNRIGTRWVSRHRQAAAATRGRLDRLIEPDRTHLRLDVEVATSLAQLSESTDYVENKGWN